MHCSCWHHFAVILRHLRKSCWRRILFYLTYSTNVQASQSLNVIKVCCHPYVTVDVVPIHRLNSLCDWSSCHLCPNNELSYKVTLFFFSPILIQYQYQRGLLIFVHATEHDWMLTAQLYHTVNLCGRICICYVSALIYPGFPFIFLLLCIEQYVGHHLELHN